MGNESFDIFKGLLHSLVEEIVNKVVDEKLKQDGNVVEKIDEIKAILKRQQISLGIPVIEGTEDTKEVFSFWDRDELIYLSDPRLFNRKKYPNCPFKSRSALQRIKTKHPYLFFKNPQGLFVAEAGDLRDFMCNQQARDIAKGKGIKTNNKRK